MRNSRFDPNVRKAHKGGTVRGKVEPYSLSTVHTSFLDHTKSHTSMKKMSITSPNGTRGTGGDGGVDYLEQLDCNYCQGGNLTRAQAIAKNNNNNEDRSVPISQNTGNRSFELVEVQRRKASASSIDEEEEETASVLVESHRQPLGNGSRLFQDEVFVLDKRPPPPPPPPPAVAVCSYDPAYDVEEMTSERDLTFRSVSTIPLVDYEIDDDEHPNNLGLQRSATGPLPPNLSRSGSLDLNVKSSYAGHNTEHAGTESLGNLDDVSSSEMYTHEHGGRNTTADDTSYSSMCNVQRSKRICSFCDFVQNGRGGRRWRELDKDFSVLMETVEKLGTILSEKEMALKGGLAKCEKQQQHQSHYHHLKHPNNNNNADTSSFDSSTDEIVEEKKVSFSFLESSDLKEKVQQLRQKKRIGISFLKTVRGKQLIVFNDGHNTYHIQGRCALHSFERAIECSPNIRSSLEMNPFDVSIEASSGATRPTTLQISLLVFTHSATRLCILFVVCLL